MPLMEKRVNIHDAKSNLSRLVEQAVAGEDIVIARAGKPLVRLVPWHPPAKPKAWGLLAGQITVPEDFDAPLDDVALKLFAGE